jgi:hypothetical protein
MRNNAELRYIVDGLFIEAALAIGGLVATHRVGDTLVWQLMRCLDAIRQRAVCRLEAEDNQKRSTPMCRPSAAKPHPAIEHFLRSVAGRPESSPSRSGVDSGP